jgi:hypothetical protein
MIAAGTANHDGTNMTLPNIQSIYVESVLASFLMASPEGHPKNE